MEYTLEQIKNENKEYLDLCHRFFNLAKSEEQKKVLEEILNEGKFGDFIFSSEICCNDNSSVEMKRRISMADLYLRRPESFQVIVENKVNLFHGTNANALLNILKYGLNSLKTSEEMGIPISTGEEWSRSDSSRSFISFTDSLDIAEYYSAPNSEGDNLAFEVIIGTDKENIIESGIAKISSDVTEVGVKSSLPVESIKVIMVPKDKVNFVKKMINNNEINVVPINDYNNKFYYYDVLESYDPVVVSEESYANYYAEKEEKSFDVDEVKKVCSGRLLSNVKAQIDKMKSIIMKDGDLDYDGRTI